MRHRAVPRTTADVGAVGFARENGQARRGPIGYYSVAGRGHLRRRDPDRLERPEGEIEIDATGEKPPGAAASSGANSTPPSPSSMIADTSACVTTPSSRRGRFSPAGALQPMSSKAGLDLRQPALRRGRLADGRVVTAMSARTRISSGAFAAAAATSASSANSIPAPSARTDIVLAGLALEADRARLEAVRAGALDADGAPDELSTACVVITACLSRSLPSPCNAAAAGHGGQDVGDPDAGVAEGHAAAKDPRLRVDPHPAERTAFRAIIDPMAPKGLRLLAGSTSRACRMK